MNRRLTDREIKLQTILAYELFKEENKNNKIYLNLENDMKNGLEKVNKLDRSLCFDLEEIFYKYIEEVKKEYFTLGVNGKTFLEETNQDYLNTLIDTKNIRVGLNDME